MRQFNVEINGSKMLLNGNPVENPVLRVLIGGLAMLMFGLGIIWMGIAAIAMVVGLILFFVFAIILAPLWLPGNYVLQHYGRNGFMTLSQGSTKFDFSLDSFRKVSSH